MAMARTVMTLSEDMIVGILLRLAVKILARFRCVSNHWRSLISDPQFAKRHFKRASEHTQKILLSTPSTLGFIEIDAPFWDGSATRDLFFRFKQRGRAVKTVGSCNGLVCVALYNQKDFYIWNPSTGAHRKLPDPEVSPDGGTDKYGFGYDSSSGDYKVLVAFYVARNPGHFLGSEGKLFSLKRNSWIRIQVLDDPYISYYSAGILCNGALHWEVLLDEPYNCEMIVAFNLAEEKFVNVPYPPIPIEEYAEEEDIDICFRGLRNLGGRLCLTCYRTNSSSYW